MGVRLVLAAVLALLTGCASLKDDARLAVGADLGTTVAGISAGVAKEANPLLSGGAPGALLASVGLRLGLIEWADGMDEPGRSQALGMFSAITWGVVGNNIGVLLGIGAAPLLGVAVGLAVHQRNAEFLAICQDMMRKDPLIQKCEA